MQKTGKEIFFLRERTTMLSYSGKSLKLRAEEETRGYGVRVLSGSNLGFSFASDRKDLEEAEKKALEAAKYSPRPDFNFVQKARIPKIDIFDSKLAEMDAKALKELFDQLREGAEKHGGNAQIDIAVSEGEESLENTEGFFGSYRSSVISISVQVMDEDGYGFYGNSFCRTRDIGEPYAIGEQAAEMARNMKNPKRPENGNYLVAFEPQSIDALFDIVLPFFNGDLKRRKISLLHDKAGQKVFSEKLSFYDDPHIPYSPGSAPFDGDGIVAGRKAMAEKGVVRNFSYNLETASLEGVKSNGFAARFSYASPPSIGFSNIVVESGDWAEENEKMLRVLSFHGAHTANPTTGDFGVEVNAAFYGEGQPMRGFMIVGNIFNLFSDIYAMGKKTERINNVFSPRMIFSNVRVVPS